jgi:hypothetical protein
MFGARIFPKGGQLANISDRGRGSSQRGQKHKLPGSWLADPKASLAAPFEQGEIGPELFRAACNMGVEGMVSKHSGRGYSVGRCTHWVKVKYPEHPAYRRVQDQTQPTLESPL